MTLIVTGPTHTYADEIATYTVTIGDTDHVHPSHDTTKIHPIKNTHGIPIYYAIAGTVLRYDTVRALLLRLTLPQLQDKDFGFIMSRALDYDYGRSDTSDSGTDTTMMVILPHHNQLLRLSRTPKGALSCSLNKLDDPDMGACAHEGCDDSITYLQYLIQHTPGLDVTLSAVEQFALGMLAEYHMLGDHYQVLEHATGTLSKGLDTKSLIRTTLPPLFRKYPVLRGIYGTQYKKLASLKYTG